SNAVAAARCLAGAGARTGRTIASNGAKATICACAADAAAAIDIGLGPIANAIGTIRARRWDDKRLGRGGTTRVAHCDRNHRRSRGRTASCRRPGDVARSGGVALTVQVAARGTPEERESAAFGIMSGDVESEGRSTSGRSL